MPKTGEPVKTVKEKVKYAEKEIIPSRNKARTPAYSEKRAPIEHNKRGHAEANILNIIFAPPKAGNSKQEKGLNHSAHIKTKIMVHGYSF